MTNVEKRRRKRRVRKLKNKLWEAAYDLAEMGLDRDGISRVAKRGHNRYHENMVEYGNEKSVPIWARCR